MRQPSPRDYQSVVLPYLTYQTPLRKLYISSFLVNVRPSRKFGSTTRLCTLSCLVSFFKTRTSRSITSRQAVSGLVRLLLRGSVSTDNLLWTQSVRPTQIEIVRTTRDSNGPEGDQSLTVRSRFPRRDSNDQSIRGTSTKDLPCRLTL